MAFINSRRWPNNPGGVLIVPNQHFENLYDMPEEILVRIYVMAKKMALALKETYKCDGTSIRQYNEPAGNQDAWHFMSTLCRGTLTISYINFTIRSLGLHRRKENHTRTS